MKKICRIHTRDEPDAQAALLSEGMLFTLVPISIPVYVEHRKTHSEDNNGK